MRSKQCELSNFSRTAYSQSYCLRPESEKELAEYMAQQPQHTILARGAGLSYNDSCFNTDSLIINTDRFNHLIDFDATTGIVVCQGGVLLKDLFLLHPEFIPAVIPGTLHATVAGSVAHDVHGKNNHHQGSFGHHVVWIELLIGSKKLRCSKEEKPDLFYATIAGLGLTGVITRVALRLQKAERHVLARQQKFKAWETLLDTMTSSGLEHDYQVAWLDLLREEPRAVLSTADYCAPFPVIEPKIHAIPPMPFSCIHSWSMKLFNRFVYQNADEEKRLTLPQFNNPLDKLKHWNRLYGPRGLIQFQALFKTEHAQAILEQLIALIRSHAATPTLAVLKLFTQPGTGLLSFCQPGFTIAIDFIYNQSARNAVCAMNQIIAEHGGRVYLAKDLTLFADQFKSMYSQQKQFSQVLEDYQCRMHSDLGSRLEILK